MEEKKLSSVAKTLNPSPIQQLSYLAQRRNAINLAEGFPDFPAPSHVKDAAVSAIHSDFNQYRHVQGLCECVATKMKETQGLHVDPLTDIAVCCGQSEAFAATIFAIISQGDEVILFDPSYETYGTCIRLAGGVPVYFSLDPPYWKLDPDKLTKAFTTRTKALVLNSPHNPTGKVFSRDELEIIARACKTWDILAVTDEVYEHITFEKEKHISLASLPDMQKRTIITSSLSKAFSVTGWRIGWAIASAGIASAIRNIHINITDSAPAPFQEAALTALRSPLEFFESLRKGYESKRDFMVELLAKVGFPMDFKPMGSFFVFTELPRSCTLSDISSHWIQQVYIRHRQITAVQACTLVIQMELVEFVEEMIRKAGVVAVPGCGFFHGTSSSPSQLSYQSRYIRFAFCKSVDTLSVAAERISGLIQEDGRLILF